MPPLKLPADTVSPCAPLPLLVVCAESGDGEGVVTCREVESGAGGVVGVEEEEGMALCEERAASAAR